MQQILDSHKHKGNRQKLVALLEQNGIEDQNVLRAMNQVPRHLFMNSAFERFAYEDKAFPIAANQTISQPFTVAFQTQLLQVREGEKILEIGTGSGYQTAVLVHMKTLVYTIERQKELVDFSKEIFKKIHIKPHYQTYGDGYKGLPIFAPFDKILVTAGSPTVPKALLEQLTIGGIMVIPIGDETNQKMHVFIRLDEKNYEKMEFGDCMFVPMLIDREK